MSESDEDNIILSFKVGPGTPFLDVISFMLNQQSKTTWEAEKPIRRIAFPEGWDLILRKRGVAVELVRCSKSK